MEERHYIRKERQKINSERKFRLRTALVTGSNRGIGLGIVKKFIENDINVFACSRSGSDQFSIELERINGENEAKATPLYFDITDEKAARDAVVFAEKESDGIDILVNNAGINYASTYLMTRMSDMRNIFDTNFFAPVYLSQIAARFMMKRKRGSIINIASVSGMVNSKGNISYGSSKAAFIFATKNMAMELGQYGIRVNCISPGFIDTNMWKERTDDNYKKILEKTPLHRQGSVEEIANVALFLSGQEASYMTGCNIVVDGGGITSWF